MVAENLVFLHEALRNLVCLRAMPAHENRGHRRDFRRAEFTFAKRRICGWVCQIDLPSLQSPLREQASRQTATRGALAGQKSGNVGFSRKTRG